MVSCFSFPPGNLHGKFTAMKALEDIKQTKWQYIIFWCLSLILLLLTAPDITPSANGGEFTASGYSLGISHPTGYPTYTIFSHIFERFFPLGSIAYRSNLLSGFFLLAGVYITFLLISCSVKNRLIVSGFLLLVFLNPLVLREGLSAEVYGFHFSLTAFFYWTIWKYLKTDDYRFCCLTGLICGLGLTNHLLFVFNLPLFIAVFKTEKLKIQELLRKVSITISFLLLGLSVYLYLPIRSTQNPSIIWRSCHNFSEFVFHVTGRQFHSHLPTSFNSQILISVFQNLVNSNLHFTVYLIFFTGFFGLIRLLRSSVEWPVKTAILLHFTGILLFPAIYQIHDISSYFIPVFICSVFLSVYWSSPMIGRNKLQYIVFFVLLSISLIGSVIDMIENRIFYQNSLLRQYGQSLLASVPPNADLNYQGDNPMNSLCYLLVCEKYTETNCFDSNKNINILRRTPGKLTDKKTMFAKTFRNTSEYPQFSPFGNIYLPRLVKIDWKVPIKWLKKITGQIILKKSDWNPNYNELSAQLLINLAENSFEHGDFLEGKQVLEKIQKLETSENLLLFTASILARRGIIEEAISLLESQAAIDQLSDAGVNNLAYYYHLSGRYTLRGFDLLQDKIASRAPSDDIIRTYYEICLGAGMLKEAVQLEQRFPNSLRGNNIAQRRLLSMLHKTREIRLSEYTTGKELEDLSEDLLLPTLNDFYRLLLIRKIELDEYSKVDLEELSHICQAMNIPNSALSIINNNRIKDRYSVESIINELNYRCFNLSQVTPN